MKNFTLRRMASPARLATGVGGAVGMALLATACASGSSSTGAAPASSSQAASAPASGSASGTGAVVIKTATSSAGTLLTDGSGRAVYLWVKDTGDKSACSGACAGTWPPLTTTGTATASGGAKAADLSTITRSDGTKQVTYDGHPLYYYVGDSAPGTASGQGSTLFGASWWLVAPSGNELTGTVSSFTASGSGSTAPSSPAPATPAPSSKSAGGGWA